jgi:hypothetical protein
MLEPDIDIVVDLDTGDVLAPETAMAVVVAIAATAATAAAARMKRLMIASS